MKKVLLSAAVVVSSVFATAQNQTLSYSKFWDNWSVGVKAGANTPLKNHAYFKNARAMYGLEIGKQFSPSIGLSVEGLGYTNSRALTPYSQTGLGIDAVTVAALVNLNLSNIIGGYNGTPRFFEVEGFAGPTWEHNFVNGYGDFDDIRFKTGANLLFNLGQSKAWGVKVSPAVVYNIDEREHHVDSYLNANHARFELTAGVVYRFRGSNDAHHFTTARAFDQAEIDALNARINGLRSDVDVKNGELSAAQAKIRQLQAELNDCLNKKPASQPVAGVSKSIEAIVHFRLNKSVIDPSQQPHVERVAIYMQNNPSSKVVIKGYASPEGSIEINKRLAEARAQVVKSTLINKYNISADRIIAEGNGVGDIFSTPSWNRVSIVTVGE